VAGYLSPGWVEGLAFAAPTPGVQVRRVVTGGPDGDVAFETAVGGPPDATAAATAGGAGGEDGAGPALTLTTTYDVAARLDAGELAVPVAYMQGKLKAEGDMRTLYALLAAAGTSPG
jgi:hypothetical protein